jgi:ABC-type oligopeptide transport system ATPase subunit
MAELRSIHIKRFKNIRDAPLNLGDMNVIVGSNNSGKSSILQALHFTIGAIQSIFLENRLRGIGKQTYTVDPNKLIYVPSQDVYALGNGGRLWEQADKSVQVELGLSTGENLSVSMLKGRNRNIQIVLSDVAIARRIAGLEQPFTIFTPGLAGIAKSEQYVSDGVLLRTIARGDANLVLRNTLLRLWTESQDNEKWLNFVNDFTEMFPGIGIAMHFDARTDETITAVVVNFNDGANIPLELSGQGVLQTIQILSYIHCFAPKIVVLDEPDSHLHPNNQRLLCSLLHTISETRNVQIILSTHSRHILDSLRGIANILWAHDGGIDVAADGSDIAILLDLGALDVKERIGH